MIFDSVGNNVIIRGRQSNSERYQHTKKYESYFYVPSTEGTYMSIFGDRLAKITCAPYEIKKISAGHSKVFEDDVRMEIKYAVDHYTVIPEEPIRVCFLDIEVDDHDGYPDIEQSDKDIIAICCYDNFKKRYYSFILTPDGNSREMSRTKTGNIYYFKTEEDLIIKWTRYMHAMDFDVVTGWNLDGFDRPYLLNRMRFLNINVDVLSPIGKFDEYMNKPKGVAWIDLMEAFKKVSLSELESYSLDYVSKHFLGEGKIEHAGHVGTLWKEDFDTFIQYNCKDVELLVKLNDYKGIIFYFDNIRRFAFCSWDSVFFNTRVLDSFFLKKAREYGVVLPHRPSKVSSDTIEGAIVISPVVGIHPNVACADVKSLYPTAIIVGNMSPETIDPDGDIVVGDVRFNSHNRGFVPRVVADLWDLRQSWKKEMRKYPVHSEEYDKWSNLQETCKQILNSCYGALLMSGFRLYRREIGAAITYFGRMTNKHMQEMIRNQGYEVIAGDTDSVFFSLKENNVKEGTEVIKTINDSFPKFCEDNFGSSEFCKIEVEFDKLYSTIFFIGDEKGRPVKKRYAGLISAIDGKYVDEPYMDAKGFDLRRSDSPAFIRELQKDTLQSILENKNKNEIVSNVRNIRMKIEQKKYTPAEIAIPKGMSKQIYEYTKNIPIHIRGIDYYNKYCGGKVKREKVKYIYVKRAPDGIPQTDVISFVDSAPEGFVYDYKKMAELLIDYKFANIFASMGWGIKELQNRTLDAWF